MGESRYFENRFPDYKPETQLSGSFPETSKNKALELVSRLERQLHTADARDVSVYTGKGGIAMLYLNMAEWLGDMTYLDKALRIIEDCMNGLTKKRLSFLCGDPGVLALGAVIYHRKGLAQDRDSLLSKLQKLVTRVTDTESDLPDEILYGRAGYLYALMYVQKHIGEDCVDKKHMKKVIEVMLESGMWLARKERWPCPLMYKWHGKVYLGAAHGVSGIMYLLLRARAYVQDGQIQELIKPTIDYMMTLTFPSGNFPSSYGSGSDRLIHWCHGAPGFIHLMIASYEVFNENKYLEAAEKCAEVIWQRGLLTKGYGICHGVAGNAYGFLAMYRLTRNSKYLYRAHRFAEFCFAYGEHGCRIADRPLSMFEGMAGTIYFLFDLMRPEEAKFPAFDF